MSLAMSDQPDTHATSSYITEENSFSTIWNSSSLGNNDDSSYSLDESTQKFHQNCVAASSRISEPAKKYNSQSNYRHIPHSVRPAFQVARRNARERRRVQSVNVAFSRLHHIVPIEFGEREGNLIERVKGAAYEDARARRSSKVSILRRAIDYIKLLEEVLVIQNQAAVISFISEI